MEQQVQEQVEQGVKQSVQEVTEGVNQLQQYLYDNIPEFTRFGFKVIIAILAFFVGRKLIKWLVKFVKTSMEKASVDKGVTQFVGSLIKAILYILLIFNIATSFGVTETSVAALLGTAGVTIGLALQGGLANIAGGVILLVFKPFQVGDYIIVEGQSVAALLGTAGVTIGLALQGGLANIAGGVILLVFKPFQVGDYIIVEGQAGCEGTVYKVEMCYTTLLSIDNKHVVIPNGTLSNSIITNVTARDLRKLEVKVGISYHSDIGKAKEILEMLLREDEDTRDDKDMVVFVDELGASAVIMGFRVWVATDAYWPAKWRLNQRIKEEFDAQGIEIPVFVDELGASAVIMGFRVWVATDAYWPAKWRLNQRIKEEFDAQGIEIPYNQLQVHIKE